MDTPKLPASELPATPNKKTPQEMSFLDHLESLRWHLIRAFLSIFIFALAAFIGKSFVFNDILFAPSRTDFLTYEWLCKLSELVNSKVLCIEKLPFTIQSRTMTGQFAMHIMASAVIGLVCAFPYAFWEIWRFVRPGLYPEEVKVSRGATFYVTVLFIVGVLFGYYVVSPLAINFLSNYQVDPQVINEFDITSYVSTLAMIVLACGLIFQLPVVVYFLAKIGLVTPALMKTYRKHAVVVILIISAVITPPDPITQIFICLPILGLYQISIYIATLIERKNQASLQ